MIVTQVYDPKLWDVSFSGTPYATTPKKKGKAQAWANGEVDGRKADVVYNLGFFDMKNYSTVTYVKARGYDIGYGGIADRLTVSSGNVCGGEAKRGLGIRDNEVLTPSGGDARSRNGIGITAQGRIIVAQSTTKVTRRNFCKEVTLQVNQHWKDTVKLFLLEDGGGSTQYYSRISLLGNAPEGGREVPTVSCFKLKVAPKLHPMKVGNKGEDVRFLQLILGGLVCDGSYGNQTFKRVKESQRMLKAVGLYDGAVDGLCGEKTIAALEKARLR